MKTYFDQTSHPVVEITVSGIEKTVTFPALIDTGFDGYLSLPLSLALPLGLKLTYHTTITLADVSVKEELLFETVQNILHLLRDKVKFTYQIVLANLLLALRPHLQLLGGCEVRS